MASTPEDLKTLAEAPLNGDGTEATKRPASATQTASRAKSSKPPSQATRLVELVEEHGTTLFHTPDHVAYATMLVHDHYETWPLKAKTFRRWVARQFYEEERTTPNAQAIQDAIGVLEGHALFEGPQESVFVRLAEQAGKIYLDLANDTWQAIEISEHGWCLTNAAPVNFRRAPGMQPLPVPIEGYAIEKLRPFVNVADDKDWILLVGWLVAAFCPHGPYPLLIFHGEQGSGKSSLAGVLRALVDPNTCALRAEPRDVRDVMIAANNGWCLTFDNISRIEPWLSDALCRLSTGGGFSTRELYTDKEEVLFEASRPVALTGIEELATRGDLLDRAIIQYLPRIADGQRRAEKEFWPDFHAARPQILGALLSGVAHALRNLPDTRLATLPRMADFACWVSAAEQEFRWSKETFLKAYSENREAANDLALEDSPVVSALRSLMAELSTWQGTASELLKRLANDADEQTKRLKSWPGSPQTLSNQLRRLAPNLRAAGLQVQFERERSRKRTKLIVLEQVGTEPSKASEASETQARREDQVDAADDQGTVADDAAPTERPNTRGRNSEGLDGVDDVDASIPAYSDATEDEDDLRAN